MKFEILLSEDTAFFYWLQVVSGWDETAAVDKDTYDYYSSFIDDSAKPVLLKIREIISSHDDPRRFLQSLYSGNICDNNKTRKLIEISGNFRCYFDVLWSDCFSSLEAWSNVLEEYDFSRFDNSINRITQFMESSFDCKYRQKIYLLPNTPSKGVIGHKIRGSDFILLRPSTQCSSDKLDRIICVIVHELLHDIEFSSNITRVYMEQSYKDYIQPFGLSSPAGYSWKEMFIETLIYCFANNITGGYLRPEIFGRSMPSLEEFEGKFSMFFKEQGMRTGYVIAWAALRTLPYIEGYIEKGLTIDKGVFDIMSKEFYKKYLTKKNT